MITVVGGINVDLSVKLERFPQPGETVSGAALHRSFGGKGANQAAAVARFGKSVTLVGAVGDDVSGGEILSRLTAMGVETSTIACKRGVSTGTAIILLDEAGQNQIVVVPGANALLAPEDVRRTSLSIARSTVLIVNFEAPMPAIAAALAMARSGGITTVLNPAPWAACASLLPLADWIVPNEIETQQLCGIAPVSSETAAEAAAKIRWATPSCSVALTLGERGVWIDSPDFTGIVPGFAVQATDTVGAGDTWVGVFAAGLAEGMPPRRAAQIANAAAAISVTRVGAQDGMPSRAEVEKFLASCE